MRLFLFVLLLIAIDIGGVWYGYERGYSLGFRHGVDAAISHVEFEVNKRAGR